MTPSSTPTSEHKGVTGYYEREARAVWALFRSLCDKPLKDCSRDDGRLLVAHYEARRLESGEHSEKAHAARCRRQSRHQ